LPYERRQAHATLQDAGYRIGGNRVTHLMRDNRIEAKTERKSTRHTTYSLHNHSVASNMLGR